MEREREREGTKREGRKEEGNERAWECCLPEGRRERGEEEGNERAWECCLPALVSVPCPPRSIRARPQDRLQREASLTHAELREAGYTAKEFKAAGFSAAEFRDAGFSKADVRSVGFTAASLYKKQKCAPLPPTSPAPPSPPSPPPSLPSPLASHPAVWFASFVAVVLAWCATTSPCVSPSCSVFCSLRRTVLFQRFLMAFSERPFIRRAISHQWFPSSAWWRISATSSF